jgi:copper chaperone NosL
VKYALIALVSCLTLLVSACGNADASGPIPQPKFVFGEDLCAECSMIISEQRFAGAIGLRERGRVKHLLFDDIGEMFLFELPSHDGARYFVHDLGTSACIDAEAAFFVRSKKLRTPMGTGVAAFATEAERDAALVQYPGDRVTLSELRRSR